MGQNTKAIGIDDISEVNLDIKRILLATDGSAPAIMATKYAIALAKVLGASLKIIFVDIGEEQISFTDKIVIVDAPKETRRSTAGLTIAQIYADKNDINYNIEIVKGNVAKTIIRTAGDYEADLIIIGNTGRTGLKRLTLGSVAEAVVKNSSIPVLVIKGS
ncbi:MAG: universal stress protein [Actinobacteria bacterium]|nr:universal stress protein [Actinomycetota bacterium]